MKTVKLLLAGLLLAACGASAAPARAFQQADPGQAAF